jgi:hypothetical protein
MKRFLALFLTAVLSVSSICNLYAEDKGLSDAIVAAKGYITVPEERTEINYTISDGETGNKVVRISWSNDDGETEVSLDEDGCLLSYSDYDYNEVHAKGLSKYAPEQTQAVAESFLKTVYGDDAKLFKLESSDISRSTHIYYYRLYKNDIKVSDGTVNIYINPDTLAVTDFDGIGKEFFKLSYPVAQNVIDINKAMCVLYDGGAPKPEYRIYSDYFDRQVKRSAFLAFSVYDTTNAVNAFTGEKTTVASYFGTSSAKEAMAVNSASDESADLDLGSNFTPEELEAIDTSENLIDIKRAESIVKSCFPAAKNISFNNSVIRKNNVNGKYYIYISTANRCSSKQKGSAYATLNAETGEIHNFCYNNGNDTKDATPIDESKAKAIADSYIKKLAPNESKKASEPTLSTYTANTKTNVLYDRLENGYICNGEYISLNINSNGEVIEYNNNFNSNLTYPKPNNVLSGDNAISALATMFDFGLSYSVDEDYNVKLVYSFNKTGIMGNSSATLLNYKGEPQKGTAESGIDDVKGHWAEKQITALYNNGYRLNDTLFHPDNAITTAELEDLFSSHSFKPYYIDENEDENDTVQSKTVTRYELAEYIMEYYGLDKLSNHPNIFTSYMYKDVISEEHLPAVAVATELGILSGDNYDNFNGDKTVTRAEAAVALYNILTADE